MNRNNNPVGAVLVTLVVGYVAAMQADTSTWTPKDIEIFWSNISVNATRITTTPRFKLADVESGEGILEAFGTKYLPATYIRYQEKRESAKEKELGLKENFPNGRESDFTGGKLFEKTTLTVAKSIAEMDRFHDVLCHYYLLHKAGAVTDAELAEIDASDTCISHTCILFSQMKKPKDICASKIPIESERTFAEKYLPLTIASYDRLANSFTDGKATYITLGVDGIKIDAIYGGLILGPLAERLNEIRVWLDFCVGTMKKQKLLYNVSETTAEQLAELDQKIGMEIQTFERQHNVCFYLHSQVEAVLEAYRKILLKSELLGAMVDSLNRSMIRIPGKDYSICKYEVTQWQWEKVMGSNPSRVKGAALPVEQVSWSDCQEFIANLNECPEVKRSGMTYRLPTEEEWEYACRAGATGDYCELADGTEITDATLGVVAWYHGNRKYKSHPVGQKKPNAFGLYDMHGNVWEWCQDQVDGSTYVLRGGCWCSFPGRCRASCRDYYYSGYRDDTLGFRLAATQNEN